jgi:hypothetical protein
VRPDTWKWIIIALVLVYNALIFLLMFRLKKHHGAVWRSFAGEPYFVDTGTIEAYGFVRTGVYALFQSQHWDLRDGIATGLVFAIRVLLLLCMLIGLPYAALADHAQ